VIDMSKGPWKKKKAQPKVTVESARITGSVIIKTPTRAELLQERIDILVAQHKDATTSELAGLWEERNNTPLDRKEFFSMLRWPPGVAKPHWADPPKLPPAHTTVRFREIATEATDKQPLAAQRGKGKTRAF
jgi:hypothetical protein